MRRRYQEGGLATAGDFDLQAGSDDYPATDEDAAATGDEPSAALTSAGGLAALDPLSAQAFATLAKSSQEARAALQKAREQIMARKYNRAIPLLAASAALGAPTRAGSTAESFANMAGALTGPLREKAAFEQQQQKDLLGIDTSMSGLDERTAMAQLQLAALKAKLGNTPLEKVMVPGQTNPIGMTRQEAHGKPLWVPTPASTNVSLNTDKTLYGKIADELGPEYVGQYKTALKAPRAIEQNTMIRDLLTKNPYTGTGATWKLAIGKAAKALGINYAKDDIKNTELLVSRLGQETLDNVKASGLGTGQGFTDKDLVFLQGVVGGSITLDKETLGRLADLHEKAARESVKMWNGTYSRLDKNQLQRLGLTPIQLPVPPRRSEATAAPTAPTVAEPASGEEPSGNPDDYLPAVNPAPPEALQHLKDHPETRDKFLKTFGYLPHGY